MERAEVRSMVRDGTADGEAELAVGLTQAEERQGSPAPKG